MNAANTSATSRMKSINTINLPSDATNCVKVERLRGNRIRFSDECSYPVEVVMKKEGVARSFITTIKAKKKELFNSATL